MKYRLLALTLFLLCLPTAVTAQRYARVISENATLRDMPNVSSSSILEMPEETLVKILDKKLPLVRGPYRQRRRLDARRHPRVCKRIYAVSTIIRAEHHS